MCSRNTICTSIYCEDFGEACNPCCDSAIDASAITFNLSIVGSYGKKGPIKKTKDLKRKNTVRVSLTDKGEEALQNALLAGETIERIVGVLSDKEINCLVGHLQKLRSEAIEVQTERTKRGFEDLANYFYR